MAILALTSSASLSRYLIKSIASLALVEWEITDNVSVFAILFTSARFFSKSDEAMYTFLDSDSLFKKVLYMSDGSAVFNLPV